MMGIRDPEYRSDIKFSSWRMLGLVIIAAFVLYVTIYSSSGDKKDELFDYMFFSPEIELLDQHGGKLDNPFLLAGNSEKVVSVKNIGDVTIRNMTTPTENCSMVGYINNIIVGETRIMQVRNYGTEQAVVYVKIDNPFDFNILSIISESGMLIITVSGIFICWKLWKYAKA